MAPFSQNWAMPKTFMYTSQEDLFQSGANETAGIMLRVWPINLAV